MKRAVVFAAVLAMFAVRCASWPELQPRPLAQWTVMLYFNGDNNLEADMLDDFLELAEVGGNDEVNVIVLFDRRGGDATTTDPDWDETYVFRVVQGQKPIPEHAIAGRPIGELNMGSGAVVSRFVRWGRQNFPAERYALIFSSHGTGPRLFRFGFAPSTIRGDIPDPSFKAFSPDDGSWGDHLYVRELADSLRRALRDDDLAVIGFDACLMGMVENAYALRDVGDVFVGSEELIPTTGWAHHRWLGKLIAKPSASGTELGRMMLEAYKEEAAATGNEKLTLSVVDLKKVSSAVTALSDLANSVMAAPRDTWPPVIDARCQCSPYGCEGGSCFNHIDAQRFAALLAALPEPAISQRATAAITALDDAVIDSYAGAKRHGLFGSHGLAIYFPVDGQRYRKDRFNKNGYEPWNLYYPLEFVQDSRWPQFLKKYFAERPICP